MASRKRASGSDRGRPLIDWEQAFEYFASLPDPDRSYKAVADHFGVSVRTVEKHGRLEDWRQRLLAIRTEAAEQTDARLSEQRAEKLAELELLIDASFTSYAQQLRAGNVRVAPVDLQRLFKLRDELWTQIAADNSTRRAGTDAAQGAEEDPEARRREIVLALDEAGVFERLRTFAAGEQAA